MRLESTGVGPVFQQILKQTLTHTLTRTKFGEMEDIEDMLAGAPAGFRLPISASVGVNPKKKNKQQQQQQQQPPSSSSSSSLQHFLTPLPSPKIPGTQVLHIFLSIYLSLCFF